VVRDVGVSREALSAAEKARDDKAAINPEMRSFSVTYHGGTDADRDADVLNQRAGDAAVQSFGYPARRVEVGFRYHDGEFFATQPRHQIQV
jgi:hypothetical protein